MCTPCLACCSPWMKKGVALLGCCSPWKKKGMLLSLNVSPWMLLPGCCSPRKKKGVLLSLDEERARVSPVSPCFHANASMPLLRHTHTHAHTHTHMRNTNTQVEIPGVKFAEVVCGGMHTVALSTSGDVWSWGVNDEGALGRKTLGECLLSMNEWEMSLRMT